MYDFNYQDPNEQQMAVLQGLSQPYAPNTDFGRVSMGQAPVGVTNEQEYPDAQPQQPIENQVVAAQVMDNANIAAAGDIGQSVAEQRQYQYSTQGATDSEALGEGMFAFGLAMLASASQPGSNFGQALAAGMGQGATAFTSALNRNRRYENRQALESKGFTPESIDAYIKSGDNKQLVKTEVKNYLKTKEMNGNLYQYDERNPAGTTQLVQQGPRQIKSTVDLGDKVEVHFTDGSMETRSKGMTAAQRAKAETDRLKAQSGAGNAKWEEKLVEWQDPETKEYRTMSVYADTKNPGVYASTLGSPIQLPEGAKFTSEAQMNSRTEKRYKAQDSAALLANTISANSAAAADLLGTDVNFYDVRRFMPYTESSKDQEKLTNAKSALMVSQYANMAGVAGASAATEKQLIDSIPAPTASAETKANWAKKKLAYDEKVLTATIRQHKSRYDYVDPSLEDALSQVKAQQEQLSTTLEDYRALKSEEVQDTGFTRAPSHQGGMPTAYGAAAQAKPITSFDPSLVKFK